MRELIGHELYKIFRQKSIYLMSLFLLAIIVFFLLQMRGPSLNFLYQKWEGPVSSQDIEKAIKEDKIIINKQEQGIDITWEELKLRNVYSDINDIGRYKTIQEEKLKVLNGKISKFENDGDLGYQYRKLKLEKEMLKDVKFSTLYYQRPAEQMNEYLNTFGLIFVGALIIFGLSSIFTREYTTGVDNYMLSSINGRKKIVHAKIIASLIFVAVVTLISVIFDLTFWDIMDGNDGWHADIHSIEKYWDSPYSFTLLSYFFIQVAYQLFAGFAFTLFVLFISAISKNSLVSFIICSFVFAFPLAVETFIPYDMQWFFNILKFTYTEIMLVDVLFKDFFTINVFGYPILLPIFVIGFLVAISTIVVILLYRVIANKQVPS